MNDPPPPPQAKRDDLNLVELGGQVAGCSLGCLPLLLAFAAFDYLVAWLGGRINVSFITYILDMTWRIPAYGLLAGLALAAFGGLGQLLLGWARWFNARGSTFFFKLYPQEAQLVESHLVVRSQGALMAIWLISGIGGLALFWSDVASPFQLLFLQTFGATAITYGLVIYKHRDLGIWAMYRLRRLVIPYVMLTPVACLSIFYAAALVWHFSLRFGFLGDRAAELVIPDRATRQAAMQQLVTVSSPFRISISDVGEALLWAVGAGLALAWILPMIVKRDYIRIVFVIAAAASPFVTSFTGLVDTTVTAILLRRVPPALVSIIVLILANLLYGVALDRLKSDIVCPECGLRVSRPSRFCPNCGWRNITADA